MLMTSKTRNFIGPMSNFTKLFLKTLKITTASNGGSKTMSRNVMTLCGW